MYVTSDENVLCLSLLRQSDASSRPKKTDPAGISNISSHIHR